jgi:tetratricopeptide (TPR) repeat protein
MAFNNRAYTFFKLKEYHQAERDVRISLSYNDKNAPAWLTLAAILNIDSKRKKEGEECIQKAFELGVSREEILNDEELGDLRKIIQ